jgi:hypothetical protein
MITIDEAESLRNRLQELKVEHRDLDAAIAQLLSVPPGDELLMRRLKKRKLQLKDKITFIEARLEPDIPA